MNETNSIYDWLLSGDPAIVYQVSRDLLEFEESKLIPLKKKIEETGWGYEFLSRQDTETYMWGNGIYSPKWISTTYTLMDLKNLGLPYENTGFRKGIILITEKLWSLPEKPKDRYQDLCICGFLLNLCCYSKIENPKLNQMVDYILDKQFDDGGWNCLWERNPKHSSLHTTINLLEGIREYLDNGYSYRAEELSEARKKAHEFFLIHRLYKSDKTGEIIKKQMTMLSFPSRWWYDILRALDYFQSIDFEYDVRMNDAIELLISKKLKSGLWPVQNKHSGLVHFDMEKTGKASRWNTLRALRVLKKYGK